MEKMGKMIKGAFPLQFRKRTSQFYLFTAKNVLFLPPVAFLRLD